MKIEQVNLQRSYLQHQKELDTTIQSCIMDSAFINGPYVEKFEKEFAEYTDSEACSGVGSGTDALFLSLLALGIKPGDEVVVPSATFISTAEAVSQLGAIPVFCDVSNWYVTDTFHIEQVRTDKTKAVITVDLYGHSCNNKEIREYCDQHNLFFIQDCAHSAGAKYNNASVSKHSDLACWSFYPGKNLDCMGDGGAITGSQQLIDKVNFYKDHGRVSKYVHTDVGWNMRLDGLQASVLSVKLKYLDRDNKRRREIAEMYRNGLNGVLGMPKVKDFAHHVYHQFVITTFKRDALVDYLKQNDIHVGIHYPVPLHKQPVYNTDQCLPFSEMLGNMCVSLPIHPTLTDNEVAYVINTVNQYYRT